MSGLVEEELENKIMKKRYFLEKSGLSKGFHHRDTLKLSRELDKLINESQKLKKKKS